MHRYCNWGEKPRESVVRINFDDMKWGKVKILGIMNNVEPMDWEYYFFELSKYHSRWDTLTREDFEWSHIYYEKTPSKGRSAYLKYNDPDKIYPEDIEKIF